MDREMTDQINSAEIARLTAQIVSAYASAATLAAEALPPLIKSVSKALTEVNQPEKAPEPDLVPAVPVKKSIFPDYLVCLEDGRKLKMLRRHLRTAYNMTPEEYRARWGLPSSYPMVAPNYAEQRSNIAKAVGLGLRDV